MFYFHHLVFAAEGRSRELQAASASGVAWSLLAYSEDATAAMSTE